MEENDGSTMLCDSSICEYQCCINNRCGYSYWECNTHIIIAGISLGSFILSFLLIITCWKLSCCVLRRRNTTSFIRKDSDPVRRPENSNISVTQDSLKPVAEPVSKKAKNTSIARTATTDKTSTVISGGNFREYGIEREGPLEEPQEISRSYGVTPVEELDYEGGGGKYVINKGNINIQSDDEEEEKGVIPMVYEIDRNKNEVVEPVNEISVKPLSRRGMGSLGNIPIVPLEDKQGTDAVINPF